MRSTCGFLACATLSLLGVPRLLAGDVCSLLAKAWDRVGSYQCTYRASTSHEKKQKQTVLSYSYLKPGNVRMDIQKPKKGAVLIYNPKVSPKVRVRPFPSMPFFVLKYKLTHKRVTTSSGGTIDRSDLGNRMMDLCQDLKEASAAQDPRDRPQYEYHAGTKIPKEISFALVEEGQEFFYKYTLGKDGLIRKILKSDGSKNSTQSYEWIDLKVNPNLPPALFEKW